MKKRKFLNRTSIIGLGCAVFTLIGVYSNYATSYAAESTTNTTETQEVTTDSTLDKTTVKVTDKKSKKIYKDKKGNKIASYTFHKPVLEGDTAAIKKINEFYSKQRISQIKSFKSDAKYADKVCNVTDELTFEITYNKNGYLSILQTGYLYTGGAHGTSYRIVHTFDLSTGKEINLKDIFQLSDKEMKKEITNLFQKLFKSDEEGTYWEDALKTVKDTAGFSSPFYLTDKGVCFFYNPYDLACYARGFVEVTLNYSSNKEIIKLPALYK